MKNVKSLTKTRFRLLALLLCLTASIPQIHAAMYIVGDGVFGGWDPAGGVEMPQSGPNTYSYTTNAISSDVYFVFATGRNSNWDTFNSNYRMAPTSNNYVVTIGNTYKATKGQNNSYKFTGDGSRYIFTYYTSTNTFTITKQNNSYTFYVLLPNGGTPYLYLWNGSNNTECHLNGDWPGTQMSTTEVLADGNTWYKLVGNYPFTSVNAIVDFGNGKSQTANITGLAPGTHYITWNGNNGATPEVTQTAPTPTPPTPHYYVTGDDGLGLGGFSCNNSRELTDNDNDGIYTYTATVSTAGQYGFIFANGQNSDWTTFNSNYRIGPTGDSNVTVPLNGNYQSTQLAHGDHGNYQVTVGAGSVTFYFNPTTMEFKVTGTTPQTNNYTFYVLPDDGATTPYLYLWGHDTFNNYHPNGDWPGSALGTTEQLADGNTWYKYTGALFADLMKAIVNNGDTNNMHQTADITNLAPGTYYIRWNVNSNTYTIDTQAPQPAPTYDYTIYVRYKGNGTPYMYMWDNDGDLLGAFPGTALTDVNTFTTEVINGYTYYKYVVIGSDYASLNVILNEGSNAAQTGNIGVASGTSYFTYGGGNTYSGPKSDADPAITYYAEGSFNGWTTDGTQMTPNGNGGYTKTFSNISLISGTTYEYKVYGADGTSEGVWIGDSNGDNITFSPSITGTYDLAITLNSDGTVTHTLTLNTPAPIYINGDGILGGFSYAPDKVMTNTGNGIYTYTTSLTENAVIQFVFGDGQSNNWEDYNNHYRIGPTDGNETYIINSDYTGTQKTHNDQSSYNVKAGPGELKFYFDVNNMQYKVVGNEPEVIYYVVGQDTNIFPNAWQTGNGTEMTKNGNTYTWTSGQVHLTQGTPYEYKILGDDGNWHPLNSGNQTFTPGLTGDYTVTITFDSSTDAVNATLHYMGNIYIEGSNGLGLDWGFAPTTQMTYDSANGWYSYTYTVTEQGTYSFLFGNGQGTDWNSFNNNYRIGPQGGNDQPVRIDNEWMPTQLAGGDGGAYQINVAPGTVTICFDPDNMRLKVLATAPSYLYTFYVISTDETTVPYLYVWDNTLINYSDPYPGDKLTTTEVLADGKTWHKWSGTIYVDVLNVIVNGGNENGNNPDDTKTNNITNFEPGTYYIVWSPEREDGESYNHFELYNNPPDSVGDHKLFIHGGYYHEGQTYNYTSDTGSELKYDGNTGNYYINNITLSSNATFCFTHHLGVDWSQDHVGTRYGNGGPDYTYIDGGTNYLEINPDMINTNLSLGEWSNTYGEYSMATAGVFNILVNPSQHWVKLIKTDHKNLSPMNVYLEQTSNVEISNIQDPGTTYKTAMFDGYWPLSAYNQEQGGWDPNSQSQHYPVTYIGDTTTVDGKKWWHWQVSASIAEVFFTRTNKSPYQSPAIVRHAGVLWYTWDEINGQTVMTDHSREYFEAAANALPTNAVVMEGHYYVYFINTLGWDNVFCYAWDNAEGQYTDGYNRVLEKWPGHICELVGIDPVTGYEVWRYDLGTISSIDHAPDGILFNDGDANALSDSKEQTGDFEYINGGVFDYLGLFDGAYTLNNLIRKAAEDVRYTISNDLLGIFYDPNVMTIIPYKNKYGELVTDTIVGALYAKDLNQYGEKSVRPDARVTDYVYDACASNRTPGGSQIMVNKTSYDQSNWIKLVMSPNYDGRNPVPVASNERPNLSQCVNRIIPAGTLDVFMTDTVNPTAHVLAIKTDGKAMSYEPNVYISGNFNDTVVFNYTHRDWQPKDESGKPAYQGNYRTKPVVTWNYDQNGHVTGGSVTRKPVNDSPYYMFYVAPKPQEVAYITWVVYDNDNTNDEWPGYSSDTYQPYTYPNSSNEPPADPGRFYAPMNWDRSIHLTGSDYENMQYMSETEVEAYLSQGAHAPEYGNYYNGYMQYGGIKVNWSLFNIDLNNAPWWHIFTPGQAYKFKAIVRYARGNGKNNSSNNYYYGPGISNYDEFEEYHYDDTLAHVNNAPRRDDSQLSGYANVYFTSYRDLDESKFIIFPIRATAARSNGDGIGNVTKVEEVIADVNTERDIVAVRYYNLMGMESNKPFEGINIVVTFYSDGTRSSKKVLW